MSTYKIASLSYLKNLFSAVQTSSSDRLSKSLKFREKYEIYLKFFREAEVDNLIYNSLKNEIEKWAISQRGANLTVFPGRVELRLVIPVKSSEVKDAISGIKECCPMEAQSLIINEIFIPIFEEYEKEGIELRLDETFNFFREEDRISFEIYAKFRKEWFIMSVEKVTAIYVL